MALTDQEIDERIAREVFGWWLADDSQGISCWRAWSDPETKTWPIHASVVLRGVWGPNVRYMSGLPYFSRDMAAAWCVVEKLAESGWTDFMVQDVGCEYSTVTLRSPINLEQHAVWQMGKTVPEAICKAALRVMGKELE